MSLYAKYNQVVFTGLILTTWCLLYLHTVPIVRNKLGEWDGQPPALDHQPIKRVFNTLPIETRDFTADGLQKLINALQNNKAPGLGGIPIEMWKTGHLDEDLLEICNKTFHGDVPGIWLRGSILPFPKKGDFGVTGDYHEIIPSPQLALKCTTEWFWTESVHSWILNYALTRMALDLGDQCLPK